MELIRFQPIDIAIVSNNEARDINDNRLIAKLSETEGIRRIITPSIYVYILGAWKLKLIINYTDTHKTEIIEPENNTVLISDEKLLYEQRQNYIILNLRTKKLEILNLRSKKLEILDFRAKAFHGNKIILSIIEQPERTYYIYDIISKKIKKLKDVRNVNDQPPSGIEESKRQDMTFVSFYNEYMFIRSSDSLEIINIEIEDSKLFKSLLFDDAIVIGDILICYVKTLWKTTFYILNLKTGEKYKLKIVGFDHSLDGRIYMSRLSQNRLLISDPTDGGTIIINIEDIKYTKNTASYNKYKYLGIEIEDIKTFDQEYNKYKDQIIKSMEKYISKPLTKIIDKFL